MEWNRKKNIRIYSPAILLSRYLEYCQQLNQESAGNPVSTTVENLMGPLEKKD